MKYQNPTSRLNSFQDINLPASIMNALSKMNISKPTQIQALSIPVGLTGKDLIAVAETGSGKTLAYALPLLSALQKSEKTRALVLVPSREMAQQIQKVFIELTVDNPITISIVIGGIPSAKQVNGLNRKPRLIIGTPGRLNDHLLKDKLLLQGVEHIVIDEADRMLDSGFTPQLKSIQNTLRGLRQTLMFSASLNSEVEGIAKLFMNPATTTMIRSAQAEKPVETLTQTVLFIDKAAKNDRLLDELNKTQGGVIVFCQNQGGCERTGQHLKEYGYEMDLIHAGHTQGHRNRAIKAFRDGSIRILVTTDLLARGLDVPNVDTVINFELPAQADDFLHRIGRTARAGREGHAITFVTQSDRNYYGKIKKYLVDAKEIKVDPKFEFMAARPTNHFSERNKKRSTDTKETFDPTRQPKGKPKAKTYGDLHKPNKHAGIGKHAKKS